MVYLKHFALLQLNPDGNSPMIGVINNITADKVGANSFVERFTIALKAHFDSNDIGQLEVPDLFLSPSYLDIKITVDGDIQQIRILETWIY